MGSFLSPEEENSPRNLVEPRRQTGGSLFKNLIYFLILAIMVGGTIYAIKTNPELLGLSKNIAQDKKTDDLLIAKVGKIIELPSNETPKIATVEDTSKTKDQPFFAKAKEGDKILVYATAKKAFIYRPSENKIIEVGIVNSENQGQVAGQSKDIQVISPTPLPAVPTATTVPVATITIRPTNQVTRAPIVSLTPTVTPSQ